jgi:hypothetical protein
VAEIDYDALATKYGGKDAQGPDYDALAAKYGGKDIDKPTKKMGAVEDVVRTVPGIVPRAAAGVVGIPQTLVGLSDKAFEFIGSKLGVEPEKVKTAIDVYDQATGRKLLKEIPDLGSMTKQGWDEIAKLVTGKPFHEPETGARAESSTPPAR